MSDLPVKSVTPNTAHLAYRKALEAAMAEHGKTLKAEELLAITSNLVGQLVALQDQRVMTPGMAMAIVSLNIQEGNREAASQLMNTPPGPVR